jgi:hypothetical protein
VKVRAGILGGSKNDRSGWSRDGEALIDRLDNIPMRADPAPPDLKAPI